VKTSELISIIFSKPVAIGKALCYSLAIAQTSLGLLPILTAVSVKPTTATTTFHTDRQATFG